jgi:predicted DNA-binding transcriptional regulator YafY
MKLLELLHGQAGLDAGALAAACGTSPRTLQRDLDALGDAGFPVYFDRGYRLAAPALLPPVTFTVDQALALRLSAETATQRADVATARALSLAARKLEQALDAKPPDDGPERQLTLPVQDPRVDACVTALAGAISERRTVRVAVAATSGGASVARRMDPYRLLPSPAGVDLLAYSHDRGRMLRLPVARLREVAVLTRRFRPIPPRLLERHLHASRASAPGLQWVRLLCRPPLVQGLRKSPPVGSLTWEDGPGGSVIFTIATRHPEDLLPWILSCGDAVEVLAPQDARQEVSRIARAMADKHAAPPPATGPAS